MSGNTFALDIGEHYVKIADIEKKKSSFVAHAAAYNVLPVNVFSVTSEEHSANVSQTIRQLTADAQVKKTDANVIIPDSQSYTRIFDMPLLTDKELISAIRYQADQFIPIPIDQVSLDIHILDKNKEENKTNILLVAAPTAAINHVVKIVEDSALMPLNIENETSAVLRLIAARNEIVGKQQGATVFINFANSSSSIYLFDMEKNIPLQVHNFSIGLQIFHKDLRANFMLNEQQIQDLIERVGLTDEESQFDLHAVMDTPLKEFVSEIQRFIISSKEQSAVNVNNVFIFGDGAKFAGLESKVSEMLGLPVDLFNLADIFEKGTVADYFAQDWPVLVPTVGGSLL